MAVKLGTGDVSFRLGSGEVAAVYLGSEEVWSAVTVPGSPTITNAIYLPGDGTTEIAWDAPADDGGSEITGYVWYLDGVPAAPDEEGEAGSVVARFYPDYSGAEVEVAAVNAIGEGPKSDPVTVTAL